LPAAGLFQVCLQDLTKAKTGQSNQSHPSNAIAASQL